MKKSGKKGLFFKDFVRENYRKIDKSQGILFPKSCTNPAKGLGPTSMSSVALTDHC